MTAKLTVRLLVRSSTLALGFALVAFGAMSPVRPQSFQGTPSSPSSGPGGYYDGVNTGSGTTDVLLNAGSPQTVIDWTPTDTTAGGSPINFQSAGTTTRFIMSPGGPTNYAVLNRILPTGSAAARSVQLNGTIRSLANVSGANVTAGSIYFYSPNGIVIGGTARIDVGALGLSTVPIEFDPGTSNGTFLYPNGSGGLDVRYGTSVASALPGYPALNTGSFVQIDPISGAGAQIVAALDKSSYVTMFSPYIQQNGVMDVNGSTALVAAGGGTLSWRSGLFDIQTTLGTDGNASGVAISSTGGTTGGSIGSAASDGTDYHRVYMVAVPRNNAITMLIQGGSKLGFDVATAADVVDNAVVLSAGYNVSGAPADVMTTASGAGTGAANLQVVNTNVGSYLSANALNVAELYATGSATMRLESDLYLRGGVQARLSNNGSASAVEIVGNTIVTAAIVGTDPLGLNSGFASISELAGGSLTFGGNVSIIARDYGLSSTLNRGGSASMIISVNGDIDVLGGLLMDSGGTGGSDGAAGTGGTSYMLLAGGASLTVGGSMQMLANGIGGTLGSSPAPSGDGSGGAVTIDAAFGFNNLQVTGATQLRADGIGGDGQGGDGGNGFGGNVNVQFGPGSYSFADLRASATGRAGPAGVTGAAGGATGGFVDVITQAFGANVTVSGILDLDASGFSVNENSAAIGAGLVEGGSATLYVTDGQMTVAGDAIIHADAIVTIANAVGVGFGGDAQGGDANVTAEGGAFGFSGNLAISARAVAGQGVGATLASGVADGGNASIVQDGPGQIAVQGATVLNASATGGSGTGFSAPSSGGDAQGGFATITLLGNGTIELAGDATLDVTARGGDGITSSGTASGGSAIGGDATIETDGAASGTILIGTTGNITQGLALDASGVGGTVTALSGGDGVGGAAQGGSILVEAVGPFSTIGINMASAPAALRANATGGEGVGIGTGGSAQGGTSELLSSGGTVLVNAAGTQIEARAIGGAADFGPGGVATGGATLLASDNDGHVDTSSSISQAVNQSAAAIGGASVSGVGGDAISGVGYMTVSGNGVTRSSLTINGDAAIDIHGLGGDGAGGGSVSPNAFVTAVQVGGQGALSVNGTLNVTADAVGGDAVSPGGSGGSAAAGDISFTAVSSANFVTQINLDDISVDASATGGDGGGSSAVTSTPQPGGEGGSAASGTVSFAAFTIETDMSDTSTALLSADDVAINARAQGGAGGSGEGSSIVSGTGADGGGAGAAVGGALSVASTYFGAATDVGIGGVAFASLSADLSATGGAGGNSGTGGPGLPGSPPDTPPTPPGSAGNPGFGGDASTSNADAGASGLRSTGAPIDIAGNVSVNRNATGGDGGLFGGGFPSGPAGFATVGAFDLTVNSSDGTATGERGRLTFDNATIDSIAASNGGLPFYADNPQINVSHGDLQANSLQYQQFASFPQGFGLVSPGRLSLLDANVNITNFLTLSLAGDLTLFGDASTFFASAMYLSANSIRRDTSGAPAGVPTLFAADSISLFASSDVDLDTPIGGGSSVYVYAGGNVTTADISAPTGPVYIQAFGDISTGDIAAQGVIQLQSGDDVTVGDVTSTNNLVDISAGGDVTAGVISSVDGVDLEAGGNVATGAIDTGGDVHVKAAGNIAIASIMAGISRQSTVDDVAFEIGLGALGSVTTGNLSARGGIGIGALGGSITGGLIAGGEGVLLLARTGVTVSGITVDGDPVYVADSSMFPAALLGPSGDLADFDPAPILASSPVAMSGPIDLGQSVTGASTVVAATTGNLSAGDVSASSFIGLAATGGLLSITGTVAAPAIQLISSDIALASTAVVDAGDTGKIEIAAINTPSMRIGDGTSGAGYLLDNAEFARINSGALTLASGLLDGQAVTIQIGTLGITGPLVGSTIDLPDGDVVFATGQAPLLINPAASAGLPSVGSGVIRVSGALSAHGFTAGNRLVFNTGVVEVDATTGSIEITDAGTGLTGTIRLEADALRVAAPTVLARLATDSKYAERSVDLNAPTGTSRPNGIVRAATIDAARASSVLIQNTGTAAAPAGFVTNNNGLLLNGNVDPGTLDVIISGRFINPDVTGTVLHDQLLTTQNAASFTAQSSANNCLFSTIACVAPVPPTPDNVLTFDNLTIGALAQIATAPAVQELASYEETDQERREREQGGEVAKKALIVPPAPLISTRPLNPPTDIEEPISGSGNPGLVGGGL